MKDLVLLMPEILLGITIIALVVSEAANKGERFRFTSWIAVGGLGAGFAELLGFRELSRGEIFGRDITLDGVSFVFRVLFFLLGMLGVWAGTKSKEIAPERRSEYVIHVLSATLGGSILSVTQNMLLLIVSLLLFGFSTLMLGAYRHHDQSDSSPSGLAMSRIWIDSLTKHFSFVILGAMILGVAACLLFSELQTFDLRQVQEVLVAQPQFQSGASALNGFVFGSLFFTSAIFLSIVPMHLWFPDLCHGAPTPSVAYLAPAVPLAGLSLWLRTILVTFPMGAEQTVGGGWPESWYLVIAFCSALSMGVGGVLSLLQTSVRRALAWMVVAQGGFFVMGTLALSGDSLSPFLFQVSLCTLACGGALLALTHLVNSSDQIFGDSYASLRGALITRPELAAPMVAFLGAFLGLPPFPQFFGRFATFIDVGHGGWWWLLGVAVLSWVCTLAAVGRIVYALVSQGSPAKSRQEESEGVKEGWQASLGLAVVALPMVLAIFFAQLAYTWLNHSIRMILW